MNSHMAILPLLLLTAALAAPGCLVMADSTHKRGPTPSEATLQQVQPGKTTVGWLVGVLGCPTKESSLPDGVTLYQYDFVDRKKDEVAIFVLLCCSSTTESRESLFFEIKDQIVQNYWQIGRAHV